MFSKRSVLVYIIIGWLLYVVGLLSSFPYLLDFERSKDRYSKEYHRVFSDVFIASVFLRTIFKKKQIFKKHSLLAITFIES
jgi:hypothetical protein